jgi:hypothetical protein
MQPGSAWLLLIPVFNIIWLFIVVSRIRKSFRNLDAAGMLRRSTTAGSDAGLAMAICSALTFIPYVNFLTSVAAFVLWIIHWSGIVNGRAEIVQGYDAKRRLAAEQIA